MLTIRYESTFKRDYKLIRRCGYNTKLLEEVLELLVHQQPLPPKYRDHTLVGDCKGCRDCHITPDWLLIYQIRDSELCLILTRTGTHSDLFG